MFNKEQLKKIILHELCSADRSRKICILFKKMSFADKDNRKNYHFRFCLHLDFAFFKCKTNHAHKIKLEISQEIASGVEIELGLK